MADLERRALDACADALRQFNFRAKRRGLLVQPGTKTVSGWLGLNTATFRLPASLEVNPVVGVRHVPVEVAMLELDNRRPPLPSISMPLGYLMPEQSLRQWRFAPSAHLTAMAEDLADAVARFGQVFINKYSDWDVFSSDIEKPGLLSEHDVAKVAPIVYALNGELAGANQRIYSELSKISDRAGMYAISYRKFAIKFAAKAGFKQS